MKTVQGKSARIGDEIVITGHAVGEAPRTAVILEVLGDPATRTSGSAGRTATSRSTSPEGTRSSIAPSSQEEAIGPGRTETGVRRRATPRRARAGR